LNPKGFIRWSASVIFGVLTLTGCLGQQTKVQKSVSLGAVTAPATLERAPGPVAAKVVFKECAAGGSFCSVPGSSGGVADAGTLYQANSDGDPLASGGPSGANWPKWIKKIQVGTTGPSTAGSPECAKFAGPSESAHCTVKAGSPDVNCGVTNYYRVSEHDCMQSGYPIPNGVGGPTDRVFIRVEFDRAPENLALHENVLLTLQYAASVAHREPKDPSQCFTGGEFTPRDNNCSDMSWAFFLRTSLASTPAAFLYLVPTATNQVDLSAASLGTAVSTKQFIIPLASDPALTTLQLSRERAVPRDGDPIVGTTAKSGQILEHICVTQSPFCMGMVFHSMTLTRM
jgi:hypothetical protein